MKNWFQNLINNYTFLKFLGNRYTLVLILFVIWMLFLDNQSLWDQRLLNKQIDELEDNKTYYKEEIAKDERSIKSLKNPGETERYAREKYYMKKDSEDIYIIDIEDERIKDSVAKVK